MLRWVVVFFALLGAAVAVPSYSNDENARTGAGVWTDLNWSFGSAPRYPQTARIGFNTKCQTHQVHAAKAVVVTATLHVGDLIELGPGKDWRADDDDIASLISDVDGGQLVPVAELDHQVVKQHPAPDLRPAAALKLPESHLLMRKIAAGALTCTHLTCKHAERNFLGRHTSSIVTSHRCKLDVDAGRQMQKDSPSVWALPGDYARRFGYRHPREGDKSMWNHCAEDLCHVTGHYCGILHGGECRCVQDLTVLVDGTWRKH